MYVNMEQLAKRMAELKGRLGNYPNAEQEKIIQQTLEQDWDRIEKMVLSRNLYKTLRPGN